MIFAYSRLCTVLLLQLDLTQILLLIHKSILQGALHGAATDAAESWDEHPYGIHHRRLPIHSHGDYYYDDEEDYDYDPDAVEEDYYGFVDEDFFGKKKCPAGTKRVRHGIKSKCVSISGGCPAGYLKSKRGNCHKAPKGERPTCTGGKKARACFPKSRGRLGLRKKSSYWTCESSCGKKKPGYAEDAEEYGDFGVYDE